jgi:hypothetical protein
MTVIMPKKEIAKKLGVYGNPLYSDVVDRLYRLIQFIEWVTK